MSSFPIPEPLTGNPDTLSGFATKYHQLSVALKSAADELSILANADITISLAVDEIRSKSSEAYVDTIKVSQRYEGASTTYATYASRLRDAQHKADRARATIEGLKGSADHAQQAHDSAVSEAMFSLPSQQTADDLVRANAALDAYKSDFAAAMRTYNEALADKAAAVRDAIAQLEDAAQVSGLNDTPWQALEAQARAAYDWLKQNLTPYLKAIKAMAKMLESVLDVVSFFVSLINPALGRAIAAISLGLSLLALLCSELLFVLGEGSIGDVLASTIGVAGAALGVLVPGVGEMVTKKLGAKIASSAVGGAIGPAADRVAGVVVGVIGTGANAVPGASATLPDMAADVTSGSFRVEPPASHDVPRDLIKDGISAIPFTDVYFGLTDTSSDGLQSALSATGS